ncbi:hypothetical protein GCM10009122_53730 [Fulvivirga kasyanovii]|uniref:DUF4255 domain-containing protein n=1 Tax=Fulvivirga kasyanovii TaxID=396812 RepID=A0ABW9RUN1_9BACT|nr:DUF4255 domain-containing protein [Fulvivirga kasyanovii]MTI27703.1 DUF4255 domain-containing protein [Fulvivirga kasyanovii]
MIESVFMAMSERLNSYFANKFSTGDDFVIVSNLVNQDGTPALTESDKLIITLANVQQESVNTRPNSVSILEAPVNINIHTLISAYFVEDNYQDSFKYLSGVISFFQSNKVFNHQNTPGLDPGIDKITFEISNLDIQALSQLWGIVGGKYLPSILYKVRMVPIKDDNFLRDTAVFSGLSSNII